MNQNLRLKLLGLVFCLGIAQFTNAQTLISLNKTTTASTTENTYNASFATDASGATFWSSQSADYKQWLTVDLGQNCDVDKLQINFADGRLAVTFDILFSSDGITYNLVRTIPPTNTSSSVWVYGLPGVTRYVRFLGRGRANPLGYRVSDFKVYGYAITTVAKKTAMDTVSNRLKSSYANELQDLSGYLTNLQANGKWSNMDYGGTGCTSHALRMSRLARAYRTPGNVLYNNSQIPAKFMLAFRHLINAHYSSNNWHDTLVRVPNNLIIGLMMMKGAPGFPQDSVYRFVDFIKDDTDNPDHQGVNRTWVAGITARKGMVIDRYQVAEKGFLNVGYSMNLAGSSLEEGIRNDNSFHQHRSQIQSWSYGEFMITDAVSYIRVLEGTLLNSTITTTQRQNLSNMMLNGNQLLGYRNAVDFGTIGRDISTPGALVNISSRVLDTQILNDPTYTSQYNDWKNNLTGAAFPVTGTKFFWKSDMLTSHGPNFYLSAKVASNRTRGTEAFNKQNIKGYNLALGATNIMTTGDEYLDIFPTWDWSRIPGTTSEMSVAAISTDTPYFYKGYFYGKNVFAGGVSVDNSGILAYEHTNYKGLSAKKAYFFMENMMLCLGNGITANKTNEVVTTVNQTRSVGAITYNSPSTTLSVDSMSSNTLNWVNHNNVGYLFPYGGYMSLTNKNQSGSWNSIDGNNKSTTLQNTPMFNLYVRHSSTPTNRTYCYIVAPNKQASDMTALAANHGFVVESNTASIQAVRHTATDQYAVVFYVPGQITIDGLLIKSDKKAVVLIRKNAQDYKLTVADPEYTGSTIKITLNVNLSGSGAVYASGQTVITVPLLSGEYKGQPVTGTYTINSDSFAAQVSGKPVNSILNDGTGVQAVTLYPNPVTKTLTVSGVSEKANISVYDVVGRKYQTPAVRATIDVSGLTNGMYILRIEDQGKIVTKKFIKE
jgi:chondroitin AC lyase